MTTLPVEEVDVLRDACILLRERGKDWVPCSLPPSFTPGGYEEKAWIHHRRYPQHPLCIRRVYWRVEIGAREREDGERYLRLLFDRLEPTTGQRDKLYEVEVERVDGDGGGGLGEPYFEMVKSRGVLVKDAEDIFDPVEQVFGQEGVLFEAWQVAGDREALLVQEQLLISHPDDWGEVKETHFGARDVLIPGGKVVEVIQVLVQDDEEREYHPFPRYARY